MKEAADHDITYIARILSSEHFHFLSVLAGTYDDTVRNIDIVWATCATASLPAFPPDGTMTDLFINLELWTEEVEQGVIDNMIIFQKPFLGAARTELEQRAVKVSAKGKHVKCKMDFGARPATAARLWRPGTCRRCAASCWSPWRRRARSLWPVRPGAA